MPVRILIADDNPQVRTAMRDVLEAAGWEIIEAENGEDAIAKGKEFKPDLIILDLAMPAKDGLTASRELSDLFPGTPILLHTLYSSPQIQIEAVKSRVRKVVPKSETSTLLAAVQEMLNPQPAPADDQVQTTGEVVRQRTDDRIRELCAHILSTSEDDALQPILSELRDLLHTHVESLRTRLAGFPAISERRARNGLSPTGAAEEMAPMERSQAAESDAADKAPQIGNAKDDSKALPQSKSPCAS
jgi:two-component system, chemotaxis family, chemotaxis protein CheY